MDDLVVKAVAGDVTVNPTGHTYDPATNAATFTFANPPNGNYRATLGRAGVTDAAGNPLAADHVVEFFVLAGDLNRDRRVNGSDFAILAGNFGKDGMTFEQGDLNGDGSVNGSDFAVLAGNFGKTVPAAVATTAAPAAASAPAAKAVSAAPRRRVPPPQPRRTPPPRRVLARRP
jgi:hypothetical protein